MRLIDADVAIANLGEEPMTWCDTEREWAERNQWNEDKLAIETAPTIDAIPIQYVLTTIRKWNRDGYAESAEALEILVMNWDEEKTEWSERREE